MSNSAAPKPVRSKTNSGLPQVSKNQLLSSMSMVCTSLAALGVVMDGPENVGIPKPLSAEMFRAAKFNNKNPTLVCMYIDCILDHMYMYIYSSTCHRHCQNDSYTTFYLYAAATDDDGDCCVHPCSCAYSGG